MTSAMKNAEKSSNNLKKSLTETSKAQKDLKTQTEKASDAARYAVWGKATMIANPTLITKRWENA